MASNLVSVETVGEKKLSLIFKETFFSLVGKNFATDWSFPMPLIGDVIANSSSFGVYLSISDWDA